MTILRPGEGIPVLPTIAIAVAHASGMGGRLRVEAAAPFVEAAVFVLDKECHVPATRGTLAKFRSTCTPEAVNLVVAVVGDELSGVVVYSLPATAALRLAGKMLGERPETLDSMAQSALAELANVISGQATTRLAKSGYATDLAPPQLVLGAGSFLSAAPITFLAVPLHTPAGVLTANIALREAASWGALGAA